MLKKAKKKKTPEKYKILEKPKENKKKQNTRPAKKLKKTGKN